MRKSNSEPEGSLTGPQLKVMEEIWAAGPKGALMADVCHTVAAKESVARTTALSVMQRLEQRGWIIRKGSGRKLHYIAARSRERTLRQLCTEMADEFFGGSATQMVMSLLGTKKIKPDEIQRLKQALEEAEGEKGR